MLKQSRSLAVTAFALLGTAACERQQTADETTKERDQTVEGAKTDERPRTEAGERIEAAGERAGERLEAAGERAGERMDAAGERIDAAGERMDADLQRRFDAAERRFDELERRSSEARRELEAKGAEARTELTNALLKLLEEPPPNVTLFLIAHQPARLLPTIRSRCRELRLTPLAPRDLADALTQAGGEIAPEDRTALAELSGGSVGEAFRLTNLDGLKLYTAVTRLFSTLPRLERPQALALAELAAARGAAETFDLLVTLIDLFLARLARFGASGQAPPEAAPNEAQLLTRLAPHPQAARAWADLAADLSARARRGKAVNLDPAALLMDMLLKVDETAGSLALR